MFWKFGAGAFLAVFSGSIAAANWVTLATTDKINTRIDTASVERRGAIVKFWIEADYQPAKRIDGKLVSRLRSQWAANCVASTASTGETLAYAPDGDILWSERGTLYDFRPIAPDTIGYAAAAAVCQTF